MRRHHVLETRASPSPIQWCQPAPGTPPRVACNTATLARRCRRGRPPINLGSHKGRTIRQAIRSAGAKLLFLPKYSPDLNPIEQLFAKLKHHLRTAQRRTRDTLADAVIDILGTVIPEECSNYFAHDGYRQT